MPPLLSHADNTVTNEPSAFVTDVKPAAAAP